MRNLLARTLATLTGTPRYFPEFEWSYSWAYNAFRAYEHIFGRRVGIRAEMSSRVRVTDVVGEVTYAFHTWEAALVFAEDKVRDFFRSWKLAPFRIYIPIIATPSGMSVFASPYLFAIAADAVSNSIKNSAGTTWSVAHTITGSNTLLVVGWGADQTTVTAIDYNGTSMTATVSETSQAKKAGMYHILAPTTGTNNINFTRSASSGTDETCNASYSGVAQSGQPDATATNTTITATPIASSITTVAANCWVVMFSSLWTPTSQAAGTNTFKREAAPDPAGDPNIFDLYDTNAAVAAGSNTLNVTYVGTVGTQCSMCLASFAPVAAAAAALPFRALLGVGI